MNVNWKLSYRNTKCFSAKETGYRIKANWTWRKWIISFVRHQLVVLLPIEWIKEMRRCLQTLLHCAEPAFYFISQHCRFMVLKSLLVMTKLFWRFLAQGDSQNNAKSNNLAAFVSEKSFALQQYLVRCITSANLR